MYLIIFIVSDTCQAQPVFTVVFCQDIVRKQVSARSPTHQLIDLGERGVLDMQPVGGNTIQSGVVQHHLTDTHTQDNYKRHENTDEGMPLAQQRGENQYTAPILKEE